MIYPCHSLERIHWCDRDGPGGFMGHTCEPVPKRPGIQKRDAVLARVTAALGDEVICNRCGATFKTMNSACTANLLDPCPGFVRVDEVQAPIEREVFLIDPAELTLRIAESCLAMKRPPGVTAREALAQLREAQPDIVAGFDRAAIRAAEYFVECINKSELG